LARKRFNLLNHPNFASPFLPLFVADPGSNGFSLNSSNREVGTGGFLLGATGDVGVGNPFLGGGWERSSLPVRPECCGKLASSTGSK